MTEKKYCQNPLIAWREIDSEAVLVDPRTGDIRVLNDVGTFIWSFCEQAHALEDIAEYIAKIFDISTEVASEDAKDFIEECINRDLIHVTTK